MLAAAVSLTGTAAAAAHAGDDSPDLGANVTVFDPSMPVSEIQATLDATHAAQVDNEMGTDRYAYLFKPGTYGTAENPLQIKVGYYTEIAGLGASPTDVVINGKVEVYNRCLATAARQLPRAGQLLAHPVQPVDQRQRGRPGRLPRVGELLGRLPGGVHAPR